MDTTPPPKLPPPPASDRSIPEKPPFALGRIGWALLVVCTLQVLWLVGWRLDWSPEGMPRSVGYILGTIFAMFSFSIVPSWLVWRLAKKPGRSHQYVLYFIIIFLTAARVNAPGRSSNISPQFTSELQQGLKEGLKKVDDNNLQDSAQPLLAVLDKQAASGGSEAVVASVMAQFSHEIQATTNLVDTATKAAASTPMPSATDPESYDRKIAADNDALKTIHDEIAFINAIPSRIDAIIQSKNQPGLANDQMIIGFKHGVVENLPLLLDYYTAMENSYQSGVEIFSLLKSNQGHWHLDDNQHRILDDAAAQKKYDAALAANKVANAQLAKDKALLVELQKQNLQKTP